MAHYVTALNQRHDVNNFDCGTPVLNIWLQSIAGQHQKKFLSKTYVLIDDEAPAVIIGYYALSIRSMTPNTELPAAMARKLPREVPGYTLARLAVGLADQQNGYGETLLVNAMERARNAATEVGGYALFVDAKDEKAAAFYRKYGFLPFVSDPLTLCIPMASIIV